MNDMTEQRAALTAAQLLRGEMLVAVQQGILDPDDAINAARASSGKALRPILLKDLVLGSGMSERDWRDVRTRMFAALGREYPTRKLTIGWLLHARAGGRRHYAFHDALRPRAEPPSRGFPWGG